MKITKSKVLTAGVVAAAAGVGLWFYYSGSAEASFRTAPVERGKVQATISATGSCNAMVTVQVGSQVSGNIKGLYADFNTKVKKGQLVALIDPESFQARVDQTKASLASARTAVASAQAQVVKADADIAGSRAAVANQNAVDRQGQGGGTGRQD